MRANLYQHLANCVSGIGDCSDICSCVGSVCKCIGVGTVPGLVLPSATTQS